MRNSFTKGLFIGSIVGATLSMMRTAAMEDRGSRTRMMKAGRRFVAKSGKILGNIMDDFLC